MTDRTSSNNNITWWLFLSIIVILNAPNFLTWEKDLYPGTYIIDLFERLLKCVLLASAFLALFSRPWLAWLVSWGLFLWWLPVSIAVRLISDAPITANLVGIALASSPGELRNLLQSIPTAIVLGFILWNVLCTFIFFILKNRAAGHWNKNGRLALFAICSTISLLPYIYSPPSSEGVGISNAGELQSSNDPFGDADKEIGTESALSRAFPYELPWAIAQYIQAKRVVTMAHAGLHSVSPTEAIALTPGSPDIVVLVIGESSSRKAWHVFNPAQPPTTPHLTHHLVHKSGLYLFSNVVALSNATRLSVPSMLTPQPLIWFDGTPNPQATESIVSLASKAGYASAWFSNQAAVGRFDGVIAAYADEADSSLFLNPASFFQQGTYDEVLLPSLKRQIAANSRSFVVLHTMGSHFKFEQRYPSGFGIFRNPENVEQAYLNSIVYTDNLLNEVIGSLEQDGRPAAMIYISDHGQGRPDAICKKSDVNRVTIDSYEIPALVWLSPSYEKINTASPQALKNNALSAYTTAAIHQTLKDLIAGDPFSKTEGASTPYASFLRSPEQNLTRIVAAPNLRKVDIKAAAEKNACFIGTH